VLGAATDQPTPLLLTPPLLPATFSLASPQGRLGFNDAKASAIMGHHFFKTVNWEKLQLLEIKPPWVPELDGTPTDVSYVDSEFKEAEPCDEPVEGGDDGVSQARFDNFTYTMVFRAPGPDADLDSEDV